MVMITSLGSYLRKGAAGKMEMYSVLATIKETAASMASTQSFLTESFIGITSIKNALSIDSGHKMTALSRPSSIQTLLSVPESHRFCKMLADFTAGGESHPALKIYSV